MPQWQCPLQCEQSAPHCRDFPFFLSRTMLLIANATAAAKRSPTMMVPIRYLPSALCLFFFDQSFSPLICYLFYWLVYTNCNHLSILFLHFLFHLSHRKNCAILKSNRRFI